MIRQYPLTPAAGKRLIAKALVSHPLVTQSLHRGRLVIVAGTTNGYVAEEILSHLGQAVGFSRQNFFRGITVSPAWIAAAHGRPPDNGGFPGDVVIDKGVWQRAETVFGVAGTLSVKGANALDIVSGQAANFVDHPDGGPMAASGSRRYSKAAPTSLFAEPSPRRWRRACCRWSKSSAARRGGACSSASAPAAANRSS